jgi:spore coat protein U-like protein
MKRLFARLAVAAAVAAAGSSPSLAATANGTMAVAAGILASCELVSANELNFATITAADMPFKTATTTLAVKCSDQPPYAITMDAGQNSTDYRARKMKGGANLLLYAVTFGGYSGDWSDDPNAGLVFTSTGTGANQSITVNGLANISAGLPAPGLYNDVLTVTIHY